MWFLLTVLGRSPAGAEARRADETALARMAQGDHDGLAELYDRHARAIYSLALRILQDRAEAEDVVQDVFAQVWTQAARYDTSRGAVAAWMLMMARSRSIDRLRSRRARPDNTADTGATLNMPDAGVPQDLQLLSAEEVARLRRALAERAYYEGLTHAEIAERLEEPLGTVKTRIRQAVIRLRESLA